MDGEKEPIRVSIVEDDDDMRAMIERYLRQVGMRVDGYGDTSNLDVLFQTNQPQVIVLDVNLPGENGLVAAARLRARSMVGIVMLTGRAGRDDRLLGLSMGVDHYLAKPVDLPELESIIRNLARRFQTVSTVTPPVGTEVAPPAGQGWALDMASWLLTAPNGESIELSSAEYSLLLPLLEHPGRPDSRDTINARLGKPRLDSENRSLDVLVSRIRRKIENGTGLMLPLRAARGAGYVFTGAARIHGKAPQ